MAATGMSGLSPLDGRPETNAKKMLPKATYKVESVHQVEGRQGVASEGDYFWVSGSKTLAKYDKNWNLIEINKNPFEGYSIPSNHIGDIDESRVLPLTKQRSRCWFTTTVAPVSYWAW